MKAGCSVFAGLILLLLISCKPAEKHNANSSLQSGLSIAFHEDDARKKIDVLVNGKLFTSYRWPDNVYKPILYPLISAGGSTITRGFPLEPRKGESRDHRHQVGNWLNYGDVNGYDFWGNGHSGEKSVNGGEIKHIAVRKLSPGAGEASLITTASWVNPGGKELLTENTEYHFFASDSVRIIDRITTLTANGSDTVHFKDTKEGMFGIRVARELELPSDEETTEKATGNYRSSEGITGTNVWGTRARWMNLYGNIADEKVSIVICDHPDNIGYPTYWHARPYGLFAANPLGVKDFTRGNEELNFRLAPEESLTFRYRIVLTSGDYPTDAEIAGYADDFAKKY